MNIFKKLSKSWRCYWYNLCPRCESEFKISGYGQLSSYDPPDPYYFCPSCSTKSDEFLELYDLLQKGIR